MSADIASHLAVPIELASSTKDEENGRLVHVVVETARGYEGVEAVIDKDRASALLASSLEVPLLVLSTGVEQVAWHFHQPDQRLLASMTAAEATRYLAEGEFPRGSMGPKVEAAVDFLARGGKEVLITTPAALERAIAGQTGTRIVPDPIPAPVGRS